MEILSGLSAGVFIYLAFSCQVLGFMSRDELYWRGLMLLGSFAYLSYYANIVDEPLWDGVVTTSIVIAVNLTMLIIVIRERTTWGMTAEELSFFRHFELMSPGQFRLLYKCADRVRVDEATQLIADGEFLDEIYYVLSGSVTIEKFGKTATISDGVFVGEVSYLTGGPATATVEVAPGSVYLKWSRDTLQIKLARSRGLNAALVASLNLDLANKVALGLPIDRARSI